MITEDLVGGHRWLRICQHDWDDPLDPTFAQRAGGRWNPPDSWRTLYLNEDLVTARLNLDLFVADWPYEPEDLRSDTGPHLAVANLPRNQQVVDVHTPEGVAAVGLPVGYPLTADGSLIEHGLCQRVGGQVHTADLRGIRCRSARAPRGAGRELAWFPASRASRATLIDRLGFGQWYWS